MSTHVSSSLDSLKNVDVIVSIVAHTGVLTLNRPKALNAINLDMIRELYSTLKSWETNPAIARVLIKSNSEKAFCAGGDVRSVYHAQKSGDRTYCDAIFREEYQLNHLIHTYSKPIQSAVDGVCMGGGLGLSAHADHRLVTERSILAMPESAIGFFTDIGASFFLNQCPGEIGTYLGLTGNRLTGVEAVHAQLADYYCHSSQLHQIEYSFNHGEIIKKESEPTPPSLFPYQSLINEIFCKNTVEEILEALESNSHPICTEWLETLSAKCPLSLKVTLSLLRRNRGKPIAECLNTEFRVSQHFMENPNFFEGVRALLVDKDQKPHWTPPTLKEISDSDVDQFFAPLHNREELGL